MSIGLNLGLFGTPGGGGGGGSIGEVLAAGWQFQPSTPAVADPADPNGGSPETFTVQRAGFDTSGNAATRTLTVTKMKRVRDVYPATTPSADPAISLSRDIYVGDTVVGGTNSSTLAMDPPVGMWLTEDRLWYETGGSGLTYEVAVFHASMCDGPARVTVRITDGSTTITASATATTTGTAYHNGLNPPRYVLTFSDAALATLTEGEVTVHCLVQPYWGSAWDTETDGQTYGASYTGWAPRKLVVDKGGLGRAYAVVDEVNGTAGAGDFTSTTIKETLGGAELLDGTANAYTSVGAAAAALQAYANANLGRNDAGGCVIILSENGGGATQSDFDSVVTTLGSLTIQAISSAATPVAYTTALTSTRTLPLHTIWRDVAWTVAANTHIPWDGPAGTAFRSCQIIGGSITAASGFNVNAINTIGNWWLKDVDGSALSGNISTGSRATVATLIGCSGVQTGYVHFAFGNTSPNIQVNNALTDRPQPVGQIVAFNSLLSDTGEGITMAAGSGAAGMVVVGNLMEYIGSVPAAGAVLSLVVGTEEVRNLICVGNSIPLEKANILYSDNAGDTNLKRPGLYAGNIFYSPNHKGDHFATDGTSIGNWPMRFRVNCKKNIHTTGDDQNDGVGPTEWQGELLGLGEVFGSDGTPVSVPWTDNQTTGNGLGAGGGDYSLTGDTSAVPKWAIGERPYTHDLFGSAIANDGTAVIGAVQ